VKDFPDLDAFVSYLRIERSASEHTVAMYSADLRMFCTFLGRGPVSASRDDIRRFLASQCDLQLAPNTIARRFQTIRSFYKFLRYSGMVRVDPSRGIRAPKWRLPLIENVPDPDVAKLIAYLAEQPESPTVLRDRAMIQTLYDSGLRVGELITLRLADLDFTGMSVLAIGKGNKQRLAPMSPPQALALTAYLERGRPVFMRGHAEHGIVFVTAPGGPHRMNTRGGHPLTRQRAFQIVQGLGQAVLGRDISPHKLRHSFGSTLIAHGADPRNVQALMGHSDLDTTMRYIHVDMGTVKAVHAKTHPRG